MDTARAGARTEELLDELDRLRIGLDQLQDELTQLTGTATSRDGLVTAVVDARGELQHLELDPHRLGQWDARQVARVITETVQAASAAARAEVTSAYQRNLPDGALASVLPGGLPPSRSGGALDILQQMQRTLVDLARR